PVVISVAEGELTYQQSTDCVERLYGTRQALVDPGNIVHTAWNSGSTDTVLIATFYDVPDRGRHRTRSRPEHARARHTLDLPPPQDPRGLPMAHQWRGVIAEYADRLPATITRTVVTLREGGTPLIPAEHLSELVGAEVHVKYEGLNPTGSFKDRGMTAAISDAARQGAKAVICASTGNTSASAAAYA